MYEIGAWKAVSLMLEAFVELIEQFTALPRQWVHSRDIVQVLHILPSLASTVPRYVQDSKGPKHRASCERIELQSSTRSHKIVKSRFIQFNLDLMIFRANFLPFETFFEKISSKPLFASEGSCPEGPGVPCDTLRFTALGRNKTFLELGLVALANGQVQQDLLAPTRDGVGSDVSVEPLRLAFHLRVTQF